METLINPLFHFSEQIYPYLDLVSFSELFVLSKSFSEMKKGLSWYLSVRKEPLKITEFRIFLQRESSRRIRERMISKISILDFISTRHSLIKLMKKLIEGYPVQYNSDSELIYEMTYLIAEIPVYRELLLSNYLDVHCSITNNSGNCFSETFSVIVELECDSIHEKIYNWTANDIELYKYYDTGSSRLQRIKELVIDMKGSNNYEKYIQLGDKLSFCGPLNDYCHY